MSKSSILAAIAVVVAFSLPVNAQDSQEVADLRTRAAAGDASAQVALASMYMAGEGVPEDFVTASAWLRVAASSGVDEDQERTELSRLERQASMTLDEMLEELPKACDIGVKSTRR